MCGRFTKLTYEEVVNVIGHVEYGNPIDVGLFERGSNAAALDGNGRSSRDAYPGSVAYVIVPRAQLSEQGFENEESSLETNANASELVPMKMNWGFSVSWNDNPVFNTRIETALTSKMWSESIQNRRCIVPTLGFYESHSSEQTYSSISGRKIKRPYKFNIGESDLPVTFLGGIWKDGCFSIMTTEPNDVVSQVHNRMPLVLRPGEIEEWLEGDFMSLVDRSNVELVSQGIGKLAGHAPYKAGGKSANRAGGRPTHGNSDKKGSGGEPEQLSLF
ncbi:MAG: SOS response-associated peptidase [Coriobacteriales bacterium]